MNIWQFRKILRPILEPLSSGEQAQLFEEEYEGVVHNINEYVRMRSEIVEKIISKLPYKDTRTLIKIGKGALLIRDAQKRKIKSLKTLYSSHADAILYGTSIDHISAGIDEIRQLYESLARTAFTIAHKRKGRTVNLLAIDKEKWLRR